MKFYRIILWVAFITAVSAQDVVLEGQLWGSTLAGDDPAQGVQANEQLIGYIPTLSIGRSFSSGLIDMEVAHRLGYQSDLEGNRTSSISKAHRHWIRYSGEKLEVRFGLQKIAFGPALVLRPLSWFDTIDLEDPTGQTDGVTAFRVKYFTDDDMVLWGWAVKQASAGVAYGGRLEFSLPSTEVGLTYHSAAEGDGAVNTSAGFALIPPDISRAAIDLRYDGFFGFWLESVLTLPESIEGADRDSDLYTTIGADYTLPLGSGILVMAEHMTFPDVTGQKDFAQLTASIASLPLGMFDAIMIISYYDWNNDRFHNYLRYSRTYDTLSANLMISASPRRESYGISLDKLPDQLAGFGTTVNFMLIYNH